MLIFIINLYCPNAYNRPDDSIRIVEYHRLLLLFSFLIVFYCASFFLFSCNTFSFLIVFYCFILFLILVLSCY
jgi:hypothetical protein